MNYESRKTVIDELSEGYKERGKEKPLPNKSDYEQLKKMDKDDLNPLQLLTLADYEQQEQRMKQGEKDRHKTSNNGFKGDPNYKDEEFVSQSEFDKASERLAAVKRELEQLKGEDNE